MKVFSMICSAFLGVLVSDVVEIIRNSKKKPIGIYLTIGVIAFLLCYIYYLCGKVSAPSRLYLNIKNIIVEGADMNIIIQCLVICILVVSLIIVNQLGSGFLSFKQYSKKIYNFTAKVREGGTITLIAGDMDFFGEINVNQENISLLMQDSKEYNQLLQLADKIKLQILCNNKLEQSAIDAIIGDTINPKIFYDQYRTGGNLRHSTFQQLLRIGKIKYDFGEGVKIKFYNSDKDDRGLRARFVESEGIIYRREDTRHNYPLSEVIKALKGNPLEIKERVQKIRSEEDLYSVNHLNNQEYKYYNDMFMLKWESCDADKCDKITRFCESLYRHVSNNEQKYSMALIYVNSYEIARKGEKRKEFPPFGILYLAAAVSQEPEWTVHIKAIDEHNYKLDLSEYDVVGFSIVSSYSYAWLKRCNDTSDMKPDVFKIAGGYQAEKFWHEVFRDFDTDIVFKGEGEDNIRKMCRQFRTRNFSDINGIIYKIINEPKPTKGRGKVDIDKIPEPARYLLPTQDVVMKDRLAGTEKIMIHMLFSRGCPYQCVYCAAGQDGDNKCIRYRDKELIVKELRNMKGSYNIEGFSIIDDSFLTDKRRATEICKFIASSDLDLVWSLAARVDHIDDEILDVLHDAGCLEIKFGIETGSNDLLVKMQKGFTIETAEAAIRKTKEHKIDVKLFIITGLPDENNKTHRETIDFLKKMKSENLVDRVSLLRYTPLAGSYIYDHPDKYGINPQVLKIENFEKMYLYRKSHDWWSDPNRYKDCNRWYQEIQNFVDQNWGDK